MSSKQFVLTNMVTLFHDDCCYVGQARLQCTWQCRWRDRPFLTLLRKAGQRADLDREFSNPTTQWRDAKYQLPVYIPRGRPRKG